MHFINAFILAFIAFPGTLSLPCDRCSQQAVDLHVPSLGRNVTNSPTVGTLTVNEHPTKVPHPVEKRHLHQKAPIDADWRKEMYEMALKEDRKAHGYDPDGDVTQDFVDHVEIHLPKGINPPDPLLPTGDQKLRDFYAEAIAKYEAYEQKPLAEKQVEWEEARNNTIRYIKSDSCWHGVRHCGINIGFRNHWFDVAQNTEKYHPKYKSYREVHVFPKQRIVAAQAEKDATIDLGKRLKEYMAETGKKITDDPPVKENSILNPDDWDVNI